MKPIAEPSVNHPHLSDSINSNIAQSEIDGGVWLKNLPSGRGLEVQTRNNLYCIRKLEDEAYTIRGNARFCPVDTPCSISGSTWGGSMLKVGFIGRGMHLEFSLDGHGTLTSSTIEDIREVE